MSKLTITHPERFKDVLVRTLQDEDCMLKSLSFADVTLDDATVEAVVAAIQRNESLITLDLGNTLLTDLQSQTIQAQLQTNRIRALQQLGFGRA